MVSFLILTAMLRAGLLREQPVPGDAPVETEGVRVADGADLPGEVLHRVDEAVLSGPSHYRGELSVVALRGQYPLLCICYTKRLWV